MERPATISKYLGDNFCEIMHNTDGSKILDRAGLFFFEKKNDIDGIEQPHITMVSTAYRRDSIHNILFYDQPAGFVERTKINQSGPGALSDGSLQIVFHICSVKGI
jgi:hypothetical protein